MVLIQNDCVLIRGGETQTDTRQEQRVTEAEMRVRRNLKGHGQPQKLRERHGTHSP